MILEQFLFHNHRLYFYAINYLSENKKGYENQIGGFRSVVQLIDIPKCDLY